MWIKEHGNKPVVGFIAGQTAPEGRTMGHAGAIVGGSDDTAEAKKKIMKECGIVVSDSPADIGKLMFECMSSFGLATFVLVRVCCVLLPVKKLGCFIFKIFFPSFEFFTLIVIESFVFVIFKNRFTF